MVLSVDHRAQVCGFVGRIADAKRLHLRYQPREEVVDDLMVHEDALDRDAGLSGEGEGMCGDLRRREIEVGVGLDHDRGCVPQLERNFLPRSAGAQAPADLGRTGEGKHPHALVLDEDVADLHRLPRQNIQPTSRKPRLLTQRG